MSLSLDTNILFASLNTDSLEHARANAFMASIQQQKDVVISEFILLELYGLLRNPTVLTRPLTASRAAATCERFREHPRWQVVGFPVESREFHDAFWPRLYKESFARRRAYDWRTALSLLRQGVTEFATVNLKDYEGFGFKRVWNPLREE